MAYTKDYFSPCEVASVLYNLSEPNYEDPDLTADDINTALEQLESALYVLKANAENDMNHDYYRTLWNCLQEICERNTAYLVKVTAV